MSESLLAVIGATLVAAIAAGALAYWTRGITSDGDGSDAIKQIRAAAHVKEWRYPSDMHHYTIEKARMKDIGVLLLVVMQRLFRDRRTFYPVVLVCIFAHMCSASLVYLTAERYWTPTVAWLLFALFLTSVWPYQILLGGGYQGLAQLFCLASIALLQCAEAPGGFTAFLWYGLAGAATGLMMFSSASSRKFLPLTIGAFLFSQRHTLLLLGLSPGSWNSLQEGFAIPLIGTLVIFTLALPVVVGMTHRLYARLVTAIYTERAPRWLHGLIEGRRTQPLQGYLDRRGTVLRTLTKGYLVAIGYLAVSIFLSRSPVFYTAQLWMVLGFCAVSAGLLYPNYVTNIRQYLVYWNFTKFWDHFRLYRNSFAHRGIVMSEQMRGAGLPWLVRFAWQMIPFHVAMVWLLGTLWVVLGCLGRVPAHAHWVFLGVGLLAVSPPLVGELTHSTQIARSYFPSFLGVLLLVGWLVSTIDHVLWSNARSFFWSGLISMTAVSAAWNLWMFVTDLWPSRMAAARLGDTLRKRGITQFSTYATPYNAAFVDALLLEQGGFAVRRIRTLAEVSDGYVVIPGTSAKAMNMESVSCAIQQGDFREDPVLNELIDSKRIVQYAIARFKTVGSSRFWTQESEVTSFRDLILHEITDEDRWRSHLWVLDAKRLHADALHDDQGMRAQGPRNGERLTVNTLRG